jgi:hypothetical protein
LLAGVNALEISQIPHVFVICPERKGGREGGTEEEVVYIHVYIRAISNSYTLVIPYMIVA